jgi:hypothetical protein
MSLLVEIRDAAVDAKTVAVALRNAKILASRLNNDRLKLWVDRELNGYTDKDSLPAYRIVNAPAVGDFSGPFGSGLRNQPIPSTSLPENLRDYARRAFIFEGVGALEAFIETAGTGGLSLPWPGDLSVLVGAEIVQGMNCLAARQGFLLQPIRDPLNHQGRSKFRRRFGAEQGLPPLTKFLGIQFAESIQL